MKNQKVFHYFAVGTNSLQLLLPYTLFSYKKRRVETLLNLSFELLSADDGASSAGAVTRNGGGVRVTLVDGAPVLNTERYIIELNLVSAVKVK